jgi:hypothetical protein
VSSVAQPERPRRRKRLWLLAALVVLVAVGGYFTWTVRTVRSDLLSAEFDATQLRTAVLGHDQSAAKIALTSMTTNLDSAQGHTKSPLWRVAEVLPYVGDDLHAVRVVSTVGAGLAHGALADLVAEVDTNIAEQLSPKHGRMNVSAIEGLRPLVSRVHNSLTAEADKLADIDADKLSGWVRPSYDKFADQVNSVDQAFDAANRAVAVLPGMLGKDGPRTYLLAFNNNAEIRATGGLPGALAILKADHGKLSLGTQSNAAEIGQFPQPVLPQSTAEREIYDTQVAEFMGDTNFTPEFPRTADLMRAMWAKKYHQHLDGVISVDSVSLAYLLAATGPLTMPGGVTLTSANAASQLLNAVYLRLPTDAQQNDFFEAVASGVFAKLTGGVKSPTALMQNISRSVDEGRIHVHSFEPSEQKEIDGTQLAGELSFKNSATPEVGLYLNDATGSKMSYYLRSTANLTSASCVSGVQQLAGSATFTSLAPADAKDLPVFITGGGIYGTPPGQQLVFGRIYGPVGGKLATFQFDGKHSVVPSVDDRGRPVATFAVLLKPGRTVKMTWQTRTGPGQTKGARLTMTPGMATGAATRTVGSACG